VAIKGKGKTRPRPATRAPRREPVPVPVPWVGRRWVQVVAAFVAGVLAMMAFVWATNGLRDERATSTESEELLQQRTAAQSWQQTVESQLNTVGDTTGPLPQIQPELAAAIRDLSDGKPVDGAEGIATTARAATKKAADGLAMFDLPETIRDKGFDPSDVQSLLDSQEKLAAGLRVLSSAARLLELSLAASRSFADDLLGEAKAHIAQASELVSSGWNDLKNGLAAVGITLTVQPPGGGSVPGAIPGALPGASGP
jgi:hypothetical protein